MKQDDNPERPSQYYPAFLEGLPSMQGKTVVITGCSRGLGYVTAKTIIKLGGFVVMMNRKSETANQVLQELTHECTTIDASIERVPPALVECDLLSFDSVRQACEQVQTLTKETGIDVLCCNAGIMLQPNQASQDGYDITVSTNVLSHFLITKLLFSRLQQAAANDNNGAEARIVSMSSASGYGLPALDPPFFEQRGGKMGDGGQAKYERYHQSKLANLLFTSALDDKLKEANSNVKAVACTPGVCGTDMFVHATTVMSGRPSSRSNVPSTEDGAMAQLKCICDSTVSSGDLWGPKMGTSTLVKIPLAPPQIMIDASSKERLWNACEKATGEAFEL
jgi:NAD(P)-dependent dehydrogenase (short-subunit alcohol dehydrogenase family)